MNQNEKQLYDELRSTAEECDKLMNMIFERQSPSCELKNKYKTLKNSCKNRLQQIKRVGKPINVSPTIYNRFLRNYSEAMAFGFTEPTNGNLDKMIHSLEEARYKFTKFLNE
ncbi:hypothetical protein [Thomasclavelia ramosa]|uniref:hypothetical protein n=1 Tax=Thomasclavelia ramosa TaxID=1547 RepID=UPI0034A34CDA